MNEEVLIPITMLLCAFGVLYIYFSTRHKERMSMIEKGADPSLFQVRKSFRNTSIKYGIFMVGIGLGSLIANLIAESNTIIKPEVAYFSMIFLFGGSSLVFYYLVFEKKNQNGSDSPGR